MYFSTSIGVQNFVGLSIVVAEIIRGDSVPKDPFLDL